MIQRYGTVVVKIAGIAAVALGLSLVKPIAMPPAPVVEVARATKVTCPIAGTIYSASDATVSPLEGNAQPIKAGSQSAVQGASDLRAASAIAAGVLSQDAKAYAPCLQPTAAGILEVPNPAETELVLVNSDDNEAVVDLTLRGPEGMINVLGSRGIALAPHSSRKVALSVLAPKGPVGVSFKASQGRVALLATNIADKPTRVAAATTPAKDSLVAGIADNATDVQLVITNPSEERVQASVTAFGKTASFQPASANTVEIEPNSTAIFPLGNDLAKEASALRVLSESELGVAVVAKVGDGQPANIIAGTSSTSLAAAVPAQAGSIVLTNIAQQPVSAELSVAGVTSSVEVPAQRTVSIPLAASGGLIQVKSQSPLVGAAVSGNSVVPLVDVQQRPSLSNDLQQENSLR